MATATLHERALTEATAVVGGIGGDDLARPTPCAGWDLGALVAHCIGQNHGAPPAAYAPRPVGPGGVLPPWTASVEEVLDAFAATGDDRVVLLVEFGPQARFPVGTVRAFHLLDTVVHTWDVATALGRPYRPDDELVAATLAVAGRVPGGEARERPGASFGPVLAAGDTDPWAETLALLGRRPT